MSAFRPVAAGISSFLAVTLLCAVGLGQTEADKRIVVEFAGVDAALQAMAGEMSDEDRRDRMGKFQEVCRTLIESFKSTDMTVGRFELAKAYLHVADPTAAADQLTAYLALEPVPPHADDARLLLGDALRAINRTAEAIKVYEDFLARPDPDPAKAPFARLGLATSCFLDLQFDRAITVFGEIMLKDAEHQVAADAAVQLAETYLNVGRYTDAQALCADLLQKTKDAPELERLSAVAAFCGKPAKELTDVQAWVGASGSDLANLRGRVVVLCFFVNWSVPCARELRFLSELERDLGQEGLTVWGITKTYKAGRSNWTLEKEADLLRAFRENPRAIVERELKITRAQRQQNDELGDEDDQWKELEAPITVSLAMTGNFDNHKAYLVRGVPWVVIIDREGVVRLAREGGSPVGGFQRRLIQSTVKRLLTP